MMMMMMPYIFRSKCPACDDNSIVTWQHVGCPLWSQQYLFENGNIYCTGCGRFNNIIDCYFNCGKHSNGFRPVDTTRLEAIFSAVGTFPGDDNDARQFRRRLRNNIIINWKIRHPFDNIDDYY